MLCLLDLLQATVDAARDESAERWRSRTFAMHSASTHLLLWNLDARRMIGSSSNRSIGARTGSHQPFEYPDLPRRLAWSERSIACCSASSGLEHATR